MADRLLDPRPQRDWHRIRVAFFAGPSQEFHTAIHPAGCDWPYFALCRLLWTRHNMAPLILHNVPDEELYIGDDGVQRPYAMVFPQSVPPSHFGRLPLANF